MGENGTGIIIPKQEARCGHLSIRGLSGMITVSSDGVTDHFLNSAYANAIAKCKGRTKQLEDYINAFVADPTKL